MAELKTRPNQKSVEKFLNQVEPESKRLDTIKLLEFFKKVTGEQPVMWGDSIVGFGSYHYKSPNTKREGVWLATGFSPRKQNLTVYVMNGFDNYQKELEKLGKFKTSVSCLYFKKLEDIDLSVLETIIRDSVKRLQQGKWMG